MKPTFNKGLFIRIFIVSLMAILILLIFLIVNETTFERVRQYQWLFFPAYILVFNLASEGNIFIDKYFNKKMPWFFFARKRLLRQIPIALLWTFFITFLPAVSARYIVFGELPGKFPLFAFFAFILGFLFIVTFNGIILANNFFKNWKTSFLEKEELQKEKLKSDYKLLQDQINPHFLFNSLNVLISEINHDTKTATEFTRKLSQVYRYVLQSRSHEVVKLQDELNFIRSFIYLHKIRIGESLIFTENIDENSLSLSLPPLTLQILVENAIKHNAVNADFPLYIRIEVSGVTSLVIKNNLNPKTVIESTNTGLSNIMNRYKLLGDFSIEVSKTDKEFMVKVPLIDE